MEAPRHRVLGDRYELGPAIGSGGFGTVFRARDRRSGADVAVKLVLPGLGSEPAAQRLRREGVVLRKVSSRHVARVYDSGDDAEGVWLVTELVDGAPLTTATLGRALLPHEVLRVARGLLEGLAAVHGAGVVHGDVKPTNVLVPRGDKALDGAKIVDFGLARVQLRSEVAASIGEAMTRQGTVLGTARFMAPEVLAGAEPTFGSDLYAAGLVLFDLLDAGPLFPGTDARGQLRARVTSEPQLGERVPEPLSDVLLRMLARDPAARYPDAAAAHQAVVDLDTAPVSVVRDEAVSSIRPSVPSSGTPSIVVASANPGATTRSTAPPVDKDAGAATLQPPTTQGSRTTMPPVAPRTVPPPSSRSTAPSVVPPSAKSFAPPPPSSSPLAPLRQLANMAPPASTRNVPPASTRDGAAPRERKRLRLTSLPADAPTALRETFRHLDLAMIDALARRERGNVVGRIARGLALALRLELDAAALILEPLALQSDVARAMGAAVLAPRARRVTRARVDSDREDKWIDTIDPELAGMLVAFAAALAASDDARDVDRCGRALARLEKVAGGPSLEATRATLRLTIAVTRARRGDLERSTAVETVIPILRAEDAPELAAFHVVVRALAAAGIAGEDPRAFEELERAERIAADTGALLDACTATVLGAIRASASPRDARAIVSLERASTLLSKSDAPSLEHEAEHHRGTLTLALGRWGEALVQFRAAREAAHAEHAGERELFTASLEVIAALALGDRAGAYQTAAVLGETRLSGAKGRTAALGWVARALTALSAQDREGAEDALAEAETRVKDADRQNADVYVLVEILGMLFDAARGALRDLETSAANLERFAARHGFEGFYWLDLLGGVVRGLDDKVAADKMADALRRLRPMLGPESPLARGLAR